MTLNNAIFAWSLSPTKEGAWKIHINGSRYIAHIRKVRRSQSKEDEWEMRIADLPPVYAPTLTDCRDFFISILQLQYEEEEEQYGN